MSGHMRYYFTSHGKKNKKGPVSKDSYSQEQAVENRDVILNWKVTSEIDMPDFKRESVFCGLEVPAVCLCLSSDCCLQPAAQAADGNTALRRCETRWYVSKNTSTSNSLYFTAHVWRNRTREDMPVPQLIEVRGNRWILAICFCKLCQPPVASPCECVIDWLVCGWRGWMRVIGGEG